MVVNWIGTGAAMAVACIAAASSSPYEVQTRSFMVDEAGKAGLAPLVLAEHGSFFVNAQVMETKGPAGPRALGRAVDVQLGGRVI